MATNLTPDDVRDVQFTTGLRGYDRNQVDAFREEVAARLEEVDKALQRLSSQVGDSAATTDVESEIDTTTAELRRILQQAREAAEQMRSRATADAARWRAEADAEARATREESDSESRALRASAWDAGTDLLSRASAQSDAAISGAEKDALFIRAEAEREALRLTGDARRDAEEVLREARNESERLLVSARAESDHIQESARQAAEAAQERARALENRRAELMDELEAARLSISQLEDQIDTRRSELVPEAPELPPTPSADDDWRGEDSSVRIVPADRLRADEPVDADEMAAEVEQMRTAGSKGVTTDQAPQQEQEQEPSPAAVAVPDDVVEPPPEDEVAATEEPEVESIEEETDEPAPRADTSVEPEPEPAPPPDADDAAIADLFAQLREVPSEPDPPQETATGQAPAAVAVMAEPEEATVEAAAPDRHPGLTATLATDPFDARDRLLLPVTNRTLRGVKRQIVELQNTVLEELRTAGSKWQPDAATFAAAFSGEIDRLGQESYVAGHVGAAEIVGATNVPQPTSPAPDHATEEFVHALADTVGSSLRRAGVGGGGVRQLSAAVSKVFRTWRTDEAERRLRMLARSAYHSGVLGGLDQLGVDRVTAVSTGSPCDRCPARSEASWAPGGSLPADCVLPPAYDSCESTVVPLDAGEDA